MAYQSRQRNPLLETHMQEAIQKRGKELLGFAMLGLGVLAIMLIGSYTPSDPSWLSETDAPVQNLLGKTGASLASPLYVTIGWAAWSIAMVPLVWGFRFVAHIGDDRFFSRIIFSPIAVALVSIFASTHAPTAGWGLSFGLGGLFGDTAIAAILELVPVDLVFGIKAISLLSAVAIVLLGGFVLGVNRDEAAKATRFLIVGVVLTYASILSLMGRAGGKAVQAAQAARERRHDKSAPAAPQGQVRAASTAHPEPAGQKHPAFAAVKQGFVRRYPSVTSVEPGAAETEFSLVRFHGDSDRPPSPSILD